MKTTKVINTKFHWNCLHTWRQSAKNTLWCLVGCSIGDFGTIIFFQISNIAWPTLAIMVLAIINGIITSILLETIILMNTMKMSSAFKTALGMSLISMLTMEIVMNALDVIITGKAFINIYILPIMLLAGFLTPWPYNYWRLKKYNIQCH